MAGRRGRTPAAAAAAVGGSRAEVGDQIDDRCRLLGSGGEPVVVRSGLHELVLDEALVGGQDGELVDLLVHLHQLAPGGVGVQAQGVDEVPRKLRLLQREQGEQRRVAGARF